MLNSGVRLGPAGASPEGRYLLGECAEHHPGRGVRGRPRHQRHPDQHRHAGQRVLRRAAGRGLARPRTHASSTSPAPSSSRGSTTADNVAGRSDLNQYYVGRLDVGGPRIAVLGRRRRSATTTRHRPTSSASSSARSRAASKPKLGGQVIVRPGGRISLLGIGHRRAGCATTPTRRSRARACSRTSIATSRSTAARRRWRSRRCPSIGGVGRRSTPTASCTRRNAMATAYGCMVGGQFSPQALITGRAEVGYLKYKHADFRRRATAVRPTMLGLSVNAGAVLPRRLGPAHHRVQLRPETGLLRVQRHRRLLGRRARHAAGRSSAAARFAAEPTRAAGGCRSRSGHSSCTRPVWLAASASSFKLGADIERYVTRRSRRLRRGARDLVPGLRRHDSPAAPRSTAAGRILMCTLICVRFRRRLARRWPCARPAAGPAGATRSAKATSSRSRSGRSPS